MNGHTPAPWVVVFSKKNGAALRIEAPNDKDIPGAAGCVIRQNGIGIPAGNIGIANARLIAAAPDLLWFAQQFFSALDAGLLVIDSPADETLSNVLRRGREAITKATGATS